MSIQSEIQRINTNIQRALSVVAETGVSVASGANSDNLPKAVENLAETKLNANQGTANAGKLLYVSNTGEVVVLTLGDGLTISNGVIAAAGSVETMTAERVRVICCGVPAGYTLLNYIQGSGTQYIDTGFAPNQDTTIIIEACLTGGAFLYGAEAAWKSGSFDLYSGGAVYNTVAYYKTITDTTKHIYKQDKNQFYIDGTLINSFTYAEFTNTATLCLFADNRGGTVQEYGQGKIYSCQLYDNGTLIRDFVPCINTNGVYGLYDKVNLQFYGSAGSGSFTGA